MTDRTDSDAWDKAVARLIQRTEAEEVQWREVDLPQRPSIQGFVGPQYLASVEGKQIAVYEYAFPVESDDFGKYIESSIRIEFVDSSGSGVWTWPVSTGRRELLDAIQYQTSGAKKFLSLLLA